MSLGAVSANGFASLKRGHDNSRDIPEFISFVGKYEKAMNMEVERTKSVRNAPLFSKTTREKFGALQKASMESMKKKDNLINVQKKKRHLSVA